MPVRVSRVLPQPLSVDGIDGAVERRGGEAFGDADDAGLGLGAAVVPDHAQEIRLVEADLHHLVVERTHPGVDQPDLREGRGVDRMRDPGERSRDRCRVALLRKLVAQEAMMCKGVLGT
jgi:hypothetical protein